MKKILTVVLLLVTVFSISAFDPGWLNNIVFFNGTSGDIHYIFLSPADSDYWGPEILGSERTLESRDDLGFYIYYPDECNSFDILAVDSEGNAFYLYEYQICDGTEETIAISARDLTEDQPELAFINLDIYNQTDSEIYYLFMSPSDSEMYGVDYLDESSTIIPGDSVSLLVPAGEDPVDFDILAVDEFNNTYSFTLTIDPETGNEQEVAVETTDMD